MTPSKNAILLLFVFLLTITGIAVIVGDLCNGGQLHFTNAVIGGGSLLIAVALALPVELRAALGEVMPSVIAFRKGASE